VDLTPIVEAAQNSALSEWMRTSLKAVAIINALHVISIVTVFGTILVVDLRLLGIPNVKRSFVRMHDELLRWTWGAFGIAAVTGVLLFMVNAVTYHRNTAFWLKMATIVVAGVNMLVFELLTARHKASWDKGVTPPGAARLAGALSIVLWVAVIVFGRWIGFTKGYDFTIPEDVQFDFSLPAE
jgi:hypothetical protein